MFFYCNKPNQIKSDNCFLYDFSLDDAETTKGGEVNMDNLVAEEERLQTELQELEQQQVSYPFTTQLSHSHGL